MKQLIFLLLIICPAIIFAQDFRIDSLSVDTFSVVPILVIDEDLDTLFTRDQAFNISLNEAHKRAHRAAQAESIYIASIKEFNKARSAHDALFTDSTYFNVQEAIIGQRLVATYVLREQGQAKTDIQIRFNAGGNLRFEQLPSGAAGGVKVFSFNMWEIINYWPGETIRVFRDSDKNTFRGERPNGNNIVVRMKN